MSSSKVGKRKRPTNSSKHAPHSRSARNAPSKSSTVSLLTPSLLLLEIPADTNTALPVWDSLRSQQVDVSWTVTPYSVNVCFTPLPSEPEDDPSPSVTHPHHPPHPQPPGLQPQIIIQPLPQQQAGSDDPAQNLSVVLSFPQSSPQPPRPTDSSIIAPTLVQCTSLLLPLPVLIAQPPPPPTRRPLRRTPAPHQAQSPPRGPFHTLASRGSPICDRFLWGVCGAEIWCERHHTPFPYHWQRWGATSPKSWVDLPPRAQLQLERLYCDVDTDRVTLQEGSNDLILDFEAMTLENFETYDTVRRLCNITHPAAHFPAKWRIFWFDDDNWKEYKEGVSSLLLKKMGDEETDCLIHVGGRSYEVDFIAMIQTNVTTGFQRKVRRRPAYRSPVHLHPHLRTGVLSEIFPTPTGPPAGHFDEDPLAEFRTWYPPAWVLNLEQNGCMAEVPLLSPAYQKIYGLFHQSVSETKVEILNVWQIQNTLHWDKFQRYKEYMKRGSTPGETLEKHLFHGTAAPNVQDICYNNFDHRIAAGNGTLGHGTYFARDASYSDNYAESDVDGVQHMFLAKVLVGNMTLGRSSYRRPPLFSQEDYELYDTCVDRLPVPSMFVVFDRCQCYPYYLIKYRGLPTVVDIV